MPFSKDLPEWNNPGTEPPQSTKDSGWTAGSKPPADWFNWFFYLVYQALKELQDNGYTQNEITQAIQAAAETAQNNLAAHTARKDNPHAVTKSQVGLGSVDNVKQASKEEFDAHNEDNIRHITSTERSDWNAKETPSGAQAKVDEHADRTDNPHSVTKAQVGLGNVDNTSDEDKPVSTAQAAADTKAKDDAITAAENWVKQFGLGIKDPALVSDVNVVLENGFYKTAVDTQNIPEPHSGTLINAVLEGSAILQIYTSAGTGYSYFRSGIGDEPTWGSWGRVAYQSRLDALIHDLEEHVNNKNNPHGVSTSQIGAVTTSDVTTTATANKLLKLDVNKKLPASITGNADGNAATASKLQTARTIGLGGDVTGSTAFNGSGNVTISAALVAASILSKLKTVDGSGSGLDSDLIDGKNLNELPNYVNSSLTSTTDYNIYVDFDKGSDSNDGSSAHPLKTLQKALDLLPPFINSRISILYKASNTGSTTVNIGFCKLNHIIGGSGEIRIDSAEKTSTDTILKGALAFLGVTGVKITLDTKVNFMADTNIDFSIFGIWTYGASVIFYNCTSVMVNEGKYDSVDKSIDGIIFISSYGYLLKTVINNASSGLGANWGSNVVIDGATGSGNRTGIYSATSSKVSRFGGTLISGEINEITNEGGEILG